MKKEYFTIPNLMGYFRILLIPVFRIYIIIRRMQAAFMGRLLFYVFRFCRISLTGKLQDIFIR